MVARSHLDLQAPVMADRHCWTMADPVEGRLRGWRGSARRGRPPGCVSWRQHTSHPWGEGGAPTLDVNLRV